MSCSVNINKVAESVFVSKILPIHMRVSKHAQVHTHMPTTRQPARVSHLGEVAFYILIIINFTG